MVILLLPLVAAILFGDCLYRRTHPDDGQERIYAFVIKSAPKPTAKCERYEAQILPRGQVWLYVLRDSTRTMPAFGDTVVARTHIDSYKRMKSAFVARYNLRPAPHSEPLQSRLYARLAAAGLEGDELATVGALTLGYKEDLNPDLKRHFQASGAAHVLAVSGLHTGILYALLLWVLTLGGRVKPRYENRAGRIAISALIIAVLWAYARLTGMTPSVVRAVLMITLVEIGRMCYRNSLSFNTIASAAVLILLVRPSDLWSVSFQLSFAATFAIVFFAREAEWKLHRKEWRNTWYGRLFSWTAGTVIISIAAQLGTLPVTMFYFGQISNYFLLTNLIVLPLAALLVPCGLATIALGGSWPGLMAGRITGTMAWLMNHSVGWIESLPGSTTQVSIGPGMVAVYYAMFLLFCFFFTKKD